MTAPWRSRRGPGHRVETRRPRSGRGAPSAVLSGRHPHNKEWAHMVRKFAAALVALVIAFGSVWADEIKGTFVKFADGKLTIKVDDKDKDFKIPAGLKVKGKNREGVEEEVLLSERLAKVKEGANVTVVTDGNKVTNVKVERKKKN